jgi:hypothetical protein
MRGTAASASTNYPLNLYLHDALDHAGQVFIQP